MFHATSIQESPFLIKQSQLCKLPNGTSKNTLCKIKIYVCNINKKFGIWNRFLQQWHKLISTSQNHLLQHQNQRRIDVCFLPPHLACTRPRGSSDSCLAVPLAGWSSSSSTAWEDPSPLLQARKQGRAERVWQLKHGKEKLPPSPTSQRRQRRRWVVAPSRRENWRACYY